MNTPSSLGVLSRDGGGKVVVRRYAILKPTPRQDVDLSVGDWIVHFGTAERCIIGLDYQ